VAAGTVGDVSEDPVPVLELHPEHSVWERLDHDPFDEVRWPWHER